MKKKIVEGQDFFSRYYKSLCIDGDISQKDGLTIFKWFTFFCFYELFELYKNNIRHGIVISIEFEEKGRLSIKRIV